MALLGENFVNNRYNVNEVPMTFTGYFKTNVTVTTGCNTHTEWSWIECQTSDWNIGMPKEKMEGTTASGGFRNRHLKTFRSIVHGDDGGNHIYHRHYDRKCFFLGGGGMGSINNTLILRQPWSFAINLKIMNCPEGSCIVSTSHLIVLRRCGTERVWRRTKERN